MIKILGFNDICIQEALEPLYAMGDWVRLNEPNPRANNFSKVIGIETEGHVLQIFNERKLVDWLITAIEERLASLPQHAVKKPSLNALVILRRYKKCTE